MTSWTTTQVLALAPDPASAKAGQGLASPGKWQTLGAAQQALWGECKGSGARPYQTQIALNEPAFKCSCPSRKFPCKHALGLLLLFAAQADIFEVQSPPAWVSEWLSKRERNAQTKAAKAAELVDADELGQQAKKTAARAKRASQRQTKVAAGIEELQRWLSDMLRQGLAHAQTQPPRYWDSMAARLVDAQATGLARWLREMASIPASGKGWNEHLLARLGSLQLLLRAYRRLNELPEALQADVRTQIGWIYKAEDVPADAWLQDDWLVMGQRSYTEERLQVRRTWLWGLANRRPALLLEFAYQGQTLDRGLIPGRTLTARVGFLPSNYPLRAILGEHQNNSPSSHGRNMPAHHSIAELLSAYADALSRQPWLENFPATIQFMLPTWQDEQGFLCDQQSQALPLHPQFPGHWKLLSISGGKSLTLFGEWDGRFLWPLSAWTHDQTVYF